MEGDDRGVKEDADHMTRLESAAASKPRNLKLMVRVHVARCMFIICAAAQTQL